MPGTLFKIKENELYFTAINNKNFVVEIILEKLFSKWLSIPILTLKNLCILSHNEWIKNNINS